MGTALTPAEVPSPEVVEVTVRAQGVEEEASTQEVVPQRILQRKARPPLRNSLISQAPAGNLNRYLYNWKNITNNQYIIDIIDKGYKIRFDSPQFNLNPLFPILDLGKRKKLLLGRLKGT